VDTQQLEAFIAVADCGSFSLAGDRLHLTQPAISKRIALLEQQLGVRLFDRIGRLVTPTEGGRQLLPRARRILQDMADAERAIRDLSGHVAGPLAIGTSHHIGLHRLPPVLREFSRHYPEVALQIDFMDSEKAHDAVAHGELELAVITLAPQGSAPRLRERLIWDDPLSLMVASDHPLARRARISIAQLAEYAAVLPGPGTYTGQILQSLFAEAGVQLKTSMSTNYLETLRMLAAIGLGWSVLPDSMLTEELVPLKLPGVELRRSLGYVYHQDRTLSNAARAFLAVLDQNGPSRELQ
jgi:DNA-binding transcriptional LysR family regulator